MENLIPRIDETLQWAAEALSTVELPAQPRYAFYLLDLPKLQHKILYKTRQNCLSGI